MSFISDVFGRKHHGHNNGTSGRNAQDGTTSSQPTQTLNRNRAGQVRTGAAAAVVDQHDAGSGQSGTQASQSQGATQPQPQPRQGQGAAQPGTGQVRTGAAAAAAANNPAAQQNSGSAQGSQGATTAPTTQPQGQQGLATAQAYPVATQPTLGDTGLAQRLVAQALQGNAVYFGVLPDGRGGYAYQGFGSKLELQAAVQSYSGQLAAQQAAGFSTGNFADEAVLHAEFLVLMDQLGRGIATPETEHLRVVRIWEDTLTGAQYASPTNIPANARNVRMRLAVTRKGANAQILGYL